MTNLHVLTLNCWGVPIPIVCKKRKERMLAIAEELGKGEYDIVILQEIWDKEDHKTIETKTCKTFKYSHFFYSGVIGAGLYVLSKFPICETFFHRFPVSGYVQKIQHGDWFGGKGVGLCVIKVNDIYVNLYCTHLHAEYHKENDEYLAHRISQSLELSQFIKHTSRVCDFILLAGDLNLDSYDLGYKLIRCNANLKDSWTEKKSTLTEDDGGNTCDIPTNSFSGSGDLSNPKGKRIDYILYGDNECTSIEVTGCSVTMGRIPGKTFNYSDHDGVQSTFLVKKSEKTVPTSKPEYDFKTLLLEASSVINNGLNKVQSDNQFYKVFMAVSSVVLFILIMYPPVEGVIKSFLTIFVSVVIFFIFIILYILNKNEENSLLSSRNDIKVLLRES